MRGCLGGVGSVLVTYEHKEKKEEEYLGAKGWATGATGIQDMTQRNTQKTQDTHAARPDSTS